MTEDFKDYSNHVMCPNCGECINCNNCNCSSRKEWIKMGLIKDDENNKKTN